MYWEREKKLSEREKRLSERERRLRRVGEREETLVFVFVVAQTLYGDSELLCRKTGRVIIAAEWGWARG